MNMMTMQMMMSMMMTTCVDGPTASLSYSGGWSWCCLHHSASSLLWSIISEIQIHIQIQTQMQIQTQIQRKQRLQSTRFLILGSQKLAFVLMLIKIIMLMSDMIVIFSCTNFHCLFPMDQ